MSQPGEDSRVKLDKISVLENKWRASKARLYNIIGYIDTTDPSPYAVSCILEQLDQAKKYTTSVFEEWTAILAPIEQDKLIEDFNKIEKVYNEARSKLTNTKSERIRAQFPRYAKSGIRTFFTFFQSVIQSAVEDRAKEKCLRQLSDNKLGSYREYFSKRKEEIASEAALEILGMKRMPLALLLERFRRCEYVLELTDHNRDWQLLLLLIIRQCLNSEEWKDAQEKLKKVMSSLDDS